MLVNPVGDMVITNDGALFCGNDIKHPQQK